MSLTPLPPLFIILKIYYGITQFCLFGSIGIVTITAFDRFLTIKSSNLSTRRFRYHLYSVFILLFSGKNSNLTHPSPRTFGHRFFRTDDCSFVHQNRSYRLWKRGRRHWMQNKLELPQVNLFLFFARIRINRGYMMLMMNVGNGWSSEKGV